jgi:hypothetical protein
MRRSVDGQIRSLSVSYLRNQLRNQTDIVAHSSRRIHANIQMVGSDGASSIYASVGHGTEHDFCRRVYDRSIFDSPVYHPAGGKQPVCIDRAR